MNFYRTIYNFNNCEKKNETFKDLLLLFLYFEGEKNWSQLKFWSEVKSGPRQSGIIVLHLKKTNHKHLQDKLKLCLSDSLCVRVCSIGSMRTVENGGVACNYRLTRRSYYGFRELGLLEKPHILRILRNVSMISLLRNGLYTRCPSPARNTCIFRLPHSFIYFWLLGLSKLCLFAKKRRESFDFGSWENWGKKQVEFWILCVVLVWFLKKKGGGGWGILD